MEKKNLDFERFGMPADVPQVDDDWVFDLEAQAQDELERLTASEGEAEWAHGAPLLDARPEQPPQKDCRSAQSAGSEGEAPAAEDVQALQAAGAQPAAASSAAPTEAEATGAALPTAQGASPKGIVEFDVKTAQLTIPTFLEASAGTGKTFSIKHLVLRLVVEEDMCIDTLLVMSFTRAATAELAARIKHHLSDMYGCLKGTLGRDEADPLLLEQLGIWEKRRDKALREGRADEAAFYEPEAIAARIKRSLTRFDKAAIYTIHSFAQKTLTTFAFSSGASLDWTIAEDDEAMRSDVIEDFLRRELDRYADSTELRERLMAGVGWSEKLKRLTGHPESLVPRVFLPDAPDAAEAAGGAADPIDETLKRFAAEAPAALKARKAKAGIITYDDLLTELWEKLRADQTGSLAATIRTAYRGVLIDEFQDTDPLQFAIFRRLFIDGVTPEAQQHRALFFVGDPKQAIYRFRSADLNTYLDARSLIEKIGLRAELKRNFRSSPTLVEAFNRFFSAAPENSAGPFLRPALEYTNVKPSSSKTGLFRRERGKWRELVPLEIWGSFGSPLLNADERRKRTAEAVASDIASLIAEGRAGKLGLARSEDDASPQIGEAVLASGERVALRALEPRDIAVLVRKRKDINGIREALLMQGVRLRMRSQIDVCRTPEAADLLLVLRAFNAPGDERVLRAARASRFMGEALSRIEADDESERVDLRELFEDGAKRWRSSGVAAAFADLMRRTELESRLLRVRGGERMLANYAHLIEVLHEAGRRHPTPAGLIAWFELAISGKGEEAPDDRKLRLESDANVVTGETIHSSKGLQYPVVYVPNGESFCEANKETAAVRRRHVDRSQSPSGMVLELSHRAAPADDDERAQAREELLRLAYVAMTRAAKRLVITLAQSPRSKKNNTLWHSSTVKNAFFRILTGEAAPDAEKTVRPQLERLGDDRTIALVDIETAAKGRRPRLREAAPERAADLCAAPARDRRARWRTSSFTAISRMLDDDADAKPAPYFGVKKHKTPRGDILSFPRGAQAGTCLHAMLEEADFARFAELDAAAEREAFARRIIERHLSLPSEEAKEAAVEGAAQMLYDVLNAEIAPGLRLRSVAPDMRFAELEFLLSLPSGLTADILGEALGELDPKYAVPGLSREKLTGFLTGFIDLAIAADGRFWVIDWKSNAVADTPEGYTQAAMSAEMTKHSYRLQYLIYLVALKRFLRARLGRHFSMSMIGGAIYVFLRGVRASQTTAENPQGVVFDPVDAAVIDALDDFFASGCSGRRLAAAKAAMRSGDSGAAVKNETNEREAAQ